MIVCKNCCYACSEFYFKDFDVTDEGIEICPSCKVTSLEHVVLNSVNK